MERDVLIAFSTIYFVFIFWVISSTVWLIYLSARMYMCRNDIGRRLGHLASEIMYLQGHALPNEPDHVMLPPPYSQLQ
ncbi:small hydrophobic protein [Rodent paramyxovirus]|uniref:Small hydrophobic protein n=1 Tax=Rodent paramyxovirus TaxID=1497434 RepID=A0AAD0ACI2_9MONO|nr:small hydrophobic protein [Rodent paramyxovirus]ATP66850.1 small hydrophobic protein [Rodent paramyxovirus]